MALSEMFQAVERSRDALNIIEYSLSQTTLEQVLLIDCILLMMSIHIRLVHRSLTSLRRNKRL